MPDDRERELGTRRAIERVFAADQGKILAILIRDLGDFDLAEDGLQDAFAETLRTWARRGIPSNPAAWIVTTARNRAIDRLRRLATGREKLRQVGADPDHDLHRMGAHHDEVMAAILEDDDIPDERLRLIFTSCHPAIRRQDAVALTLRAVGGLTSRDRRCVPRTGVDHAGTPQPGQGQDPQCRHSVSGPRSP